LEEFV
jgi:hypothetical protein